MFLDFSNQHVAIRQDLDQAGVIQARVNALTFRPGDTFGRQPNFHPFAAGIFRIVRPRFLTLEIAGTLQVAGFVETNTPQRRQCLRLFLPEDLSSVLCCAGRRPAAGRHVVKHKASARIEDSRTSGLPNPENCQLAIFRSGSCRHSFAKKLERRDLGLSEVLWTRSTCAIRLL